MGAYLIYLMVGSDTKERNMSSEVGHNFLLIKGIGREENTSDSLVLCVYVYFHEYGKHFLPPKYLPTFFLCNSTSATYLVKKSDLIYGIIGWLRTGGSGDRIPVGTRFSAPV